MFQLLTHPVLTLRSRPAWLLVRLWFSTSPWLAGLTVLAVVATACLPAAFGLTVASLIRASRPGSSVPMVGPCVLATALFVAQQVLGTWRSAVLAGDLGRRVTTALAERQTTALLGPSTIAHLEDPSFLDDLARATATGGIGPWAATVGLVQRSTTRLSGVAALIVLARLDAVLTAVLAVTLVVNANVLRRAHAGVVAVMDRRADALRRADHLREVGHDLAAAKDVRLFGLDGWFADRFDDAWRHAMRDLWRERSRLSVSATAAIIPLLLIVGLIVRTLALGVGAQRLDAGEVVLYAQMLVTSMGLAVVSVHDSYVRYGTQTLAAQVHLELRVRSAPGLALPGSGSSGRLPEREVRFDGVTFTYPGTSTPVLRGVDLVIRAGSSLGVVGVNGAGKSTLVKLLARLYDPDGGAITVDGIPLTDLEPDGWQRRVAALLQTFSRYPLSLRENLLLGFAPDDAVADAAARRAATAARLEDIVLALPDGWDTVLDRRFGGVDLSGGQWQRVAMARALTAVNLGAGVLVLDEPTSQLDTRAEAAFYGRFLDLTAGVTTVLISHRLAAVRRADQIVVLDAGTITERGTHSELIQARGTYARLFDLQASAFEPEVAE